MTETSAAAARTDRTHADDSRTARLCATGARLCHLHAHLAPVPEITEFPVCADCAIVIANGDSSGIEDAEAHLARMDRELLWVRNVVIVGSADRGFCTDTCGACGTYTATDDWYDATAEIVKEG